MGLLSNPEATLRLFSPQVLLRFGKLKILRVPKKGSVIIQKIISPPVLLRFSQTENFTDAKKELVKKKRIISCGGFNRSKK
jgi:hypothetical protein